MVVEKYLKDYVDDGRYTIVVYPRSKSLMHRIKELYPTSVITTSNADGIGGERLLVDRWAVDGAGLKAALGKYKPEDVVYENFTEDFVEGKTMAIKEGTAIQNVNESRHDASVWLQEVIDKLESFKQRVDDGQVTVKDGDYSVTNPAPDIERETYDYISLSVDYIDVEARKK